MTRVFGAVVNGKKTSLLVPLADMMNHADPLEQDASWAYSHVQKKFVMTCARPLSAGQQIFTSYGGKCGTSLLLNYGFCSGVDSKVAN
jgi:histone-lysine N-methyltransferase SETD3